MVTDGALVVVVQGNLDGRVKRLMTGPDIPKNIVRHQILATLTAGDALHFLSRVAPIATIHTS